MAKKQPSSRSVDDICREIRDLANTAVFIQNIKRHGFNWDLTWAAMDTIEDTQLAIGSFEIDSESKDTGKEYLKVYGLFQAIFMQQDAVKNLAEGLNLAKVDIATDSKASAVRELRNKYFGHHKYQRNGATTYHGVARITVGNNSISAWTWPKFSTEEINIKESIESNTTYIVKTLEEVLSGMQKKKSDYTRKVTTKLSEDKQSYAFEKIYSWVYGNTSDRAAMTDFGLRTLADSLKKIEQGLKQRYEKLDGIGDVRRTLDKAYYALDVVEKLYKDKPDGANGDFNAEIHVDSLRDSHDEIIDICVEVNKEFT